MNNKAKQFYDTLIGFVSSLPQIDVKAIDDTIDMMRNTLFSTLSLDDVEEVRAKIKETMFINLEHGSIIQEKGHEKWFLDKKTSLDMKYWDRYKKYLLNDKEFSIKVVNKMDDILDSLTDLLGDPSRDIAYNRRGLVIGDVQSGKTANYLGLMCKAADVGYKVIVLLTGIMEDLRRQTQIRVDEGFVGTDSDSMMKMQHNGQIIGVGKYDSSFRPMVLTSRSDDFKQRNAKNLGFDLRNINGTVVFVVKKNSHILRGLNMWLAKENGNQKINQSILVIDDEADNASVNTNKEEDSPTVINGHIRTLLNQFQKSSYVGFTATPFANIFIDPDTDDEMVKEDLFPKDYIYSLDAPSNYIGARNIYSETGNAHYMLVEIDNDCRNKDSIANILPLKHKNIAHVSKLPKDMKTAIETFILANVLEDLQGLLGNHRSMLINVSRFTAVQKEISEQVNEYLKNIQNSCKLNCKLGQDMALKDPYIKLLKDTFDRIYSNTDYEWEEVQSHLYESCGNIVVYTVNQESNEKLNYDQYPKGLRVIAIGGMSLSRGLTLEGLVTSYFYRNSRMYDTLMQMGRWFGYRGPYSDLCRIWMSSDSIEWYKHISEATDELREEIKRYQNSGLTPKDFGLRVRQDIDSLIVTAANKMKTATKRECMISFSGLYVDTPEIYSDVSINRSNLNSINELIENCALASDETTIAKEGKQYIIKNVDVNLMLEFFDKIEVSPKNEKFNIEAIRNFIRQYRGNELEKWDIAFINGSSEKEVELANGIKYSCVKRSYSIENAGKILKMSGGNRHLAGGSDPAATLSKDMIKKIKENCEKTTLSYNDYFREVDRNPLFTIYIVDLKDCKPSEFSSYEVAIKEEYSSQNNYIVGFGMGIPSLRNEKTKYLRYVLNKVAQQLFEDEADIEEGND